MEIIRGTLLQSPSNTCICIGFDPTKYGSIGFLTLATTQENQALQWTFLTKVIWQEKQVPVQV